MLAEPDEDEFAADIPRDPKKCHVEYVKCMSDRFSQLRFRHTCSRLRFLASLILNIVNASVLGLCSLTCFAAFVIDFVNILTEVRNFEKLQLNFTAYFLMPACSSLAARQNE